MRQLYLLVTFSFFSLHCIWLGFIKHGMHSYYSYSVDFLILITGAGLGGFVACRALSQRNNDPTKASRPWDIVILPITFPL